MNTQQDFHFLLNSGYYRTDSKITADSFDGTLTFSKIRILIKANDQSGYKVFMHVPNEPQLQWKHLYDVANISSTFAVVTDLEDLWLRKQQKTNKKKGVLHSSLINEEKDNPLYTSQYSS